MWSTTRRCRTSRAAALGVGALAAFLATASAVASAPTPPAAGLRPNVLLITVDTLRADHLGAYGYAVPTSPTIDRLASEGVRVTESIATAPETAPATASLLSGLYQPRHRVAENRMRLAPSVTTLAERLHAAGYVTAALVGNELIGAELGFGQGFDQFQRFEPDAASGRADARGAMGAAIWLQQRRTSPWFLWVHFMDPHGPYVATPLWTAGVHYPDGFFGEDPPIPVGPGNFGLGVIPHYQVVAGEDRLSQYIRRYDAEIHATDEQIGNLLGVLDTLGVVRDTLVVLTADHGESLTEHEEYVQHGWFVYDTTLVVPLILRWPGVLPKGAVLDAQVSGVDLTPTLLDVVGVTENAANPHDFDGQSFARLLRRPQAPSGRGPAFAVGARENHPFCIRQDRWKLIQTRAEPPPTPVSRLPLRRLDRPERLELYDLRKDPGETHNQLNAEPERAGALLPGLREFRERFRMGGIEW